MSLKRQLLRLNACSEFVMKINVENIYQLSLKAGVSTLRKRNVITWQLRAQLCDVRVETRTTARFTCVLRRFLLKTSLSVV